MKITPLDIQQMRFKVVFRGYDRREVDASLDALMSEFEALVRENNELREKTASVEIQLMDLRKKEGTLNATLMKAQELVGDMKANAQKEADLLIKEGELRAEEMSKEAREEAARLRREIRDLRREKMLVIQKIRASLKTFDHVLDLESEGCEKDVPPVQGTTDSLGTIKMS
jgi:cell division initiation protein